MRVSILLQIAWAGEFATEGRFNSPPEAGETATPGRRHRAVRRG